MKPFFHDACHHDRPRDRYLGSFEASGHRTDDTKRRYDVYVYQDNANYVLAADLIEKWISK